MKNCSNQSKRSSNNRVRIERKKKFFWRVKVIAGALVIGAPVCHYSGILPLKNIVQSEVTQKEMNQITFSSQVTDYSLEGQIGKPSGANVFSNSGYDDATDNTYGYYTVMGETTVAAEDMISCFNSRNMEYPSGILETGGAGTIEEFCSIVIDEADVEGVRGEVVFAQAMLETGWLQFQGDVSAEQFNFAGLGTTGDGVQGNCFPDVRTGIRAQVQHLKAYASSVELVNECVDERFTLVARETAPYVEWLGIQENPYGCGWAAGEKYGEKIREILADLKDELPG